MYFKNEKTKILIAFLISLTFFGIYIFTTKINPQNISLSKNNLESNTIPSNLILDNKTEKEKTNIVTLEVNNEKYEDTITNSTSVYNFMKKLETEGKINFKDETYSGMGKLIEEINGIKNNGEKNWIYYVNNKKATIGVSNYKIAPGDIISWQYEENMN